jgi:hypothetical protein
MKMKCNFRLCITGVLLLVLQLTGFLSVDGQQPPAGLKYLPAKAFHIPPETTTEESGYFALSEGKNGKIYVGTAAYGRNAYLVEFDPATEKMRVVLDAHKELGLPLEATGYAAQAKIHTRNFVGPSGTIYLGTKQGYPLEAEKKTGTISTYRGGYVMTYDPATGKIVNLGMPMPLGDPRLKGDGKSAGANTDVEGEGVIDVVADEARGLVYVITCEHEHWMLYDMKHPEKGYRALGPLMWDQPNTLIDREGRATCITVEGRIARYNPTNDKVTVDDLIVDGQPFRKLVRADASSPDWRLAADGKTAYLQLLNDLRLFEIDLSGPAGKPVIGRSVGNRKEGKNPDSRGSVSIANDGQVYSVIRIDNQTGFGSGYLHHLVRYRPESKAMTDLGVITVKNPDFFDFKAPPVKNPDGSLRPIHGFHRLPDNTLTPLHVVLAMIVARDGTIYATTLYPFTLLRIDPADVARNAGK